jgi:hypothetical protein
LPFFRLFVSKNTTLFHQSSRVTALVTDTTAATARQTVTMGDSMITPSIEYDYLIKFLALGDSGVGMHNENRRRRIRKSTTISCAR